MAAGASAGREYPLPQAPSLAQFNGGRPVLDQVGGPYTYTEVQRIQWFGILAWLLPPTVLIHHKQIQLLSPLNVVPGRLAGIKNSCPAMAGALPPQVFYVRVTVQGYWGPGEECTFYLWSVLARSAGSRIRCAGYGTCSCPA